MLVRVERLCPNARCTCPIVASPADGEMRKDVRFGLVDRRIVQAGDVHADPMRRAMDVGNQTERHERAGL